MVPSLHGKLKGENIEQWQIFFSWAPKSLWTVTAAMKLKDTCSLEKSYDKPRQQSHHLLTNAYLVKAVVFPVVMHRCERWTIKKAEH